MALRTFWNTPLPRRPSVAASKPSTLMAGTKFFTRSICRAKSSSMRVALVKHKNSQSLCLLHRAMRSSRRTMGSPPV